MKKPMTVARECAKEIFEGTPRRGLDLIFAIPELGYITEGLRNLGRGLIDKMDCPVSSRHFDPFQIDSAMTEEALFSVVHLWASMFTNPEAELLRKEEEVEALVHFALDTGYWRHTLRKEYTLKASGFTLVFAVDHSKLTSLSDTQFRDLLCTVGYITAEKLYQDGGFEDTHGYLEDEAVGYGISVDTIFDAFSLVRHEIPSFITKNWDITEG